MLGEGLRPEYDSSSPSGYRYGTHRLVLPQIDGFQWLLQAEQELNGGGLRIRSVTYDDQPTGREVHWAGFMRWWGLGVAGVYHLLHPALSAVQSLERVAPWANTALLVVLLLAVTPLLAARLGALPASLFALGSVAVYPFYYFFTPGYFDHHGIAAMANVLVVLFLVCGGAGWVRADGEVGQGSAEERALHAWLPTRSSARRWFLASALAGAVGLWISAASMAPVLLGVGAGVALAFGVGARSSAGARWQFAPELFRAWGIAGGVGSLAFYLLEYFPSYLGMRLEVNHPLYALAFVGGGDLLARWGALVRRSDTGESGEGEGGLALLGVDALLVLLVPLAILLFGASDFRLRDPFLWRLHSSYIVEFQSLLYWYQTRAPSQSVGELTLIPFVALPIAAALWPTALTGARRTAWRGVLLVAVAAGAAYGAVFFGAITRGSIPLAVVGGALVVGVWFLLPLSLEAARLAAPWQTALLVCVVPATMFLVGALFQLRWMGNAAALWVAALVVFAVVLIRTGHAQLRTGKGRAASLTLAAGIFVLGPAGFMSEPLERPYGEMIYRDAALWLRRRMGGESVTLFASPTPTTSMIWYGGFRGLGTLYWENLDGLKTTTEIAAAPTADSAKALLAKHGITHLAFFAWDAGLGQAESAAKGGATPVGFLSTLDRQIAENRLDAVPPWMVVLPYKPEPVATLPKPVMHLVEIVPDQSPELALAHLAEFYNATENREGVEASLARSLAIAPSVLALAMKAQIEHIQGRGPAFDATVAQLRAQLARGDSLALGDRLDAAIVLGLANDVPGVQAQLSAVLAGASEATLRRLPPNRLSLLADVSRRMGLDARYPEAVALAQRLALPS